MALFAFTSLTATVEAKRLGGGGSYGRQASPMRQAPAPAAPIRQQAQPAPAYPAPAPAPQQARSGMGGMLGGALLGLGVEANVPGPVGVLDRAYRFDFGVDPVEMA